MNKIITFNNVGYHGVGEVSVRNLNFDLLSNQNTLVVTDNYQVGEIVINLITGNVKPQVGEIRSHKFEEQRYFVGFNNFKNVLAHGAKVKDILNTLVNSQKNLVNATDEIDELRMMFNLEKYAEHATTDLPADAMTLLNFLMLLIVQPRLVIIEKLPLPGSDNFQSASLKYIYNYTKKHDISLVVVNNNKLIEENLTDRKITILNGKIIEDASINYVSAVQKNAVDNKTKRFDLEEDLFAALNGGSYPTIKTSTSVYHADPVQVSTTPITVQHHNPTTPTVVESQLPPENHATKNFIEIEPHDNIPFNTSALQGNEQNRWTTPQVSTKQVNATTRKLNTITEQLNTLDRTEVLVDQIKYNQTHPISQANHPTTVALSTFMGDVGELYQIKKELEKQIKGADFTNLSVELQSKVFDNYENTNRLLRENDPNEIYNPENIALNQIRTQTQALKNHATGVTAMIMEEENINTKITRQMTEILSTSFLEADDAVPTAALHQTNAVDPFDAMTTTSQPTNHYETQPFSVHPTANQAEQTVTPFEDDDFANYHPHITNIHTGAADDYSYIGSENNNSTAAFENFTRDLDNVEPKSIPNNQTIHFNQQDTVPFVHDILATNALNDEVQNTQHCTLDTTTATAQVNANNYRSNVTKQFVTPKPYVPKAKKKLSMIEKLYLEALEDINIVEEQKNNKSE